MEPRSLEQELRERWKSSTLRPCDDALMATHHDQVREWWEFSGERRGEVVRPTRVALCEAPDALQYDPQTPPVDVRQRLGPPVSKTRTRLLRSEPRDGVLTATLERRNRRTLKRYFTVITSERRALYPNTFLGPLLCHQCSRKIHGLETCWVTLWKQGGALPRNKTMPCMYCRSRKHSVDACCYLHYRCSRCGLLGHVGDECLDRAPEVWKQMFLEVAEFGVLTGRNPFGPIKGRFGLGQMPENPEALEMVDELRRKLEHRARVGLWPTIPDLPTLLKPGEKRKPPSICGGAGF